jgi:signal transduction histidine kinase
LRTFYRAESRVRHNDHMVVAGVDAAAARLRDRLGFPSLPTGLWDMSGKRAGRPPPADREMDALRLAHSGEVVGGLGGRAAIAIGGLLLLLIAAAGGAGVATAPVVVIGLFAAGVGAVLVVVPAAVPMNALDLLLVLGNGLLVILATYDSPIETALPGIYLVIGTITLAVRRWWMAVLHALLLGASYAGVLTVGPRESHAVARWLVLMTCIVSAGVFVRWLVENVSGLAVAERGARDVAESARIELERVGAAKTAFLARMSHELRTPLNVVLGFADLLGEQVAGPLNDRQSAYTEDIRASARHLVDLVDDVFDLARADSGGVQIVPTMVDVRGLLEDALSLVRRQVTDKRLSVTLTVLADVPDIEVDRLKIRQVVVNLLSNAAKFTAAGGRISITARPAGDGVAVIVRDTGVGIAYADRERIFEEYAQSGAPREGTGLGLPLARRLVELHGGTLRLVTTSPLGSSFEFFLPALATTGAPDAAMSALDRSVSNHLLAFTEPGSRANRRMIVRLSCVFGAISCAAAIMVVATARVGMTTTILTLAICPPLAVAVVLGQRRIARHAVRWVEPFLWALTVGITGLTYLSGPFEDLTPLAYGFVTIISFSFWPRRRAVIHLLGIAVSYGTVLLLMTPTHALSRWLSVLTLVAFNGEIVSWITRRLRALAIAEHNAHYRAEQVCAELVAASRHKSAFVANMSHELRTPLIAVMGFAELLDGDLVGPLNGRQRDYLREIRMAATRLLTIINDVLEMAKLEAGQLRLEREVVAIRPLVENSIAKASPTLLGKRLDIRTAFDDGAEFVVGDPLRLEQAVTHLVANAVRFTAHGGTVRVTASRMSDGEVHISVSDTGVGIGSEQRERVFDMFAQGPPADHDHLPTGTGIGLALARGLVELHGGHIWLTSRAGHGSTFTITLPDQASAVASLEPALRAAR